MVRVAKVAENHSALPSKSLTGPNYVLELFNVFLSKGTTIIISKTGSVSSFNN